MTTLAYTCLGNHFTAQIWGMFLFRGTTGSDVRYQPRKTRGQKYCAHCGNLLCVGQQVIQYTYVYKGLGQLRYLEVIQEVDHEDHEDEHHEDRNGKKRPIYD